jgi:hypothetical protein
MCIRLPQTYVLLTLFPLLDTSPLFGLVLPVDTCLGRYRTRYPVDFYSLLIYPVHVPS